MSARLALIALTALLIGGAVGASVYGYAQRAQPVNTALGCVETVVTKAENPTGPSLAQGGSIAFHDDIAPHHGAGNFTITEVYVEPGSYALPKNGDRVRVCLVSVPERDVTPDGAGCDPDRDARGREFIVYDRNNGHAEIYSNGEHGCGGA